MSYARRDFLQHFAVGAVGIGALPSLRPDASDGSAVEPAVRGDLREELLADTHAVAQPSWDTTWTGKVGGRHKAVFDSPELEGGGGVFRAGMWGGHYRQVLGASNADISTVLVIRHAAIPLAMTHAFWEEYELAKKNKITHPVTEKKTTRNPVLMTPEVDGIPPGFAALTLDKQLASGTIVLACNLAFARMVSMVATKHKLPNDEARRKALEGLVPGVILQPSGIFAVMMAQEAGCHFVRAS